MNDSKPTYTVSNDDQHAALIEKVGALMKKGEENTTPEEDAQILAMAEALMAYEQSTYEIPQPSSLESVLEIRRYDMMCEGKDLAEILGISQGQLQKIIDGDQKPDASLLEAIKNKLGIPVDLLLNHA